LPSSPERKGIGQSEFVAVKGAKAVFDKMVFPAGEICTFG
jgi:hypothetical protein